MAVFNDQLMGVVIIQQLAFMSLLWLQPILAGTITVILRRM